MHMKLMRIGQALGSIIVCQMAGVIGSLASFDAIDTWYRGLVRPSFAPPNWVFGPVWTLLYTLMGIAVFLVWEGKRSRNRTLGLWVFAIQLVLNASWSWFFFGLERLDLAFIIILVLLFAILVTMALFLRVSRAAMLLMVPYFAWVSFATLLNYAFWRLN